MTFTARARYMIIAAAILTASVIQLVRGYRPLIVIVGATTFLSIGFLIIYLSGSKQRAIDRKRKQDYFAGNS